MPTQQDRAHVRRTSRRPAPGRVTLFLAGVALFDVVIWTALAILR